MNDQPHSLATSRPHRKRTIVLVSLAVLGLCLIVGFVVYMLIFAITRDDYRHAATQTNAVITAYNKLSSASSELARNASDATATDASYQASQKSYTSALQHYTGAVSALGSEKALANSQVHSAYDAFITKNHTFVKGMGEWEANVPNVRTAALDCSQSKIGDMNTDDLSKVVAAYDAAVKPCVTAMAGLAKSDNATAAKVGIGAGDYLASLRRDVVALQAAYIAGNRSSFETTYNAFLTKASKFNVQTDTRSVLQLQPDNAPAQELNSLAQAITVRE